MKRGETPFLVVSVWTMDKLDSTRNRTRPHRVEDRNAVGRRVVVISVESSGLVAKRPHAAALRFGYMPALRIHAFGTCV